MELDEVERSAEAILFAAGDPVDAERMALAIGVSSDTVRDACQALQDKYGFERRGIRIVRLEDAYQMTSAPEWSEVIAHALETRKPPRLSASALETLSVVAYYQPTTKAFVEQIRGVDSSYTVGVLLTKHLIEERGRLNVPGRPILYGTTPDFLRTFGISSLDELPELDLRRPGIQTAEQLEMQLAMEDAETAAQTAQTAPAETASGESVPESGANLPAEETP